MNYAYVRVSTDGQTVENQKLEIENYCYSHNIKDIVYIEETISGTKKAEERKLGNLIDRLKKDDVLIITEISRLGRSIRIINNVVSKLIEKKVSVYAIKNNFELNDSISSQCLLFCFSLSAQIERDLISERTKMGLARARIEGKCIGRCKGQRPNVYKLDKYKNTIIQDVCIGKSLRMISKELNVTWFTLRNFCERNNIQYKNRKILYNFPNRNLKNKRPF